MRNDPPWNEVLENVYQDLGGAKVGSKEDFFSWYTDRNNLKNVYNALGGEKVDSYENFEQWYASSLPPLPSVTDPNQQPTEVVDQQPTEKPIQQNVEPSPQLEPSQEFELAEQMPLNIQEDVAVRPIDMERPEMDADDAVVQEQQSMRANIAAAELQNISAIPEGMSRTEYMAENAEALNVPRPNVEKYSEDPEANRDIELQSTMRYGQELRSRLNKAGNDARYLFGDNPNYIFERYNQALNDRNEQLASAANIIEQEAIIENWKEDNADLLSKMQEIEGTELGQQLKQDFVRVNELIKTNGQYFKDNFALEAKEKEDYLRRRQAISDYLASPMITDSEEFIVNPLVRKTVAKTLDIARYATSAMAFLSDIDQRGDTDIFDKFDLYLSEVENQWAEYNPEPSALQRQAIARSTTYKGKKILLDGNNTIVGVRNMDNTMTDENYDPDFIEEVRKEMPNLETKTDISGLSFMNMFIDGVIDFQLLRGMAGPISKGLQARGVGTMAANRIGTFGAVMAQTQQDYVDLAREKGFDDDASRLYGAAMSGGVGLANTALPLEAAFTGSTKKIADATLTPKMVKMLASTNPSTRMMAYQALRNFGKVAAAPLLSGTKAGVVEGIEEGVLEPLMEAAINKVYDISVEGQLTEDFDIYDNLNQFAIGAAIGGAYGARGRIQQGDTQKISQLYALMTYQDDYSAIRDDLINYDPDQYTEEGFKKVDNLIKYIQGEVEKIDGFNKLDAEQQASIYAVLNNKNVAQNVKSGAAPEAVKEAAKRDIEQADKDLQTLLDEFGVGYSVGGDVQANTEQPAQSEQEQEQEQEEGGEPINQSDTEQSPPKTSEQVELESQLDEALQEEKAAQEALDRKAKAFDQSVQQDQEDLFGNRESDSEEKLFNSRTETDPEVRRQALQQEQTRLENARQRVADLRNKMRQQGDTTNQTDIFNQQEQEAEPTQEQERPPEFDYAPSERDIDPEQIRGTALEEDVEPTEDEGRTWSFRNGWKIAKKIGRNVFEEFRVMAGLPSKKMLEDEYIQKRAYEYAKGGSPPPSIYQAALWEFINLDPKSLNIKAWEADGFEFNKGFVMNYGGGDLTPESIVEFAIETFRSANGYEPDFYEFRDTIHDVFRGFRGAQEAALEYYQQSEEYMDLYERPGQMIEGFDRMLATGQIDAGRIYEELYYALLPYTRSDGSIDYEKLAKDIIDGKLEIKEGSAIESAITTDIIAERGDDTRLSNDEKRAQTKRASKKKPETKSQKEKRKRENERIKKETVYARELRQITPNTFVVGGKLTDIKSVLRDLGGKWNAKEQGYEFDNSKKQDVLKALKENSQDNVVRRSRRKNRASRSFTKKVVKKLQKVFPNIDVEYFSEVDETTQARLEARSNPKTLPEGESPVRLLKKEDGVVYGYFDLGTGKIYLRENEFNSEDVVEEFVHVWVRTLKYSNPKLFDELINKAKKTKKYTELEDSDEYKDLKEKGVKSDVIAEEAFAKLATDEFISQMDSRPNYLKRFWRAVKTMLRKAGIQFPVNININTLKLGDLIEYAAEELLLGVPVSVITSEQLARAEKIEPQKEGFRIADTLKGETVLRNPSDYNRVGKFFEYLQKIIRANLMGHLGLGRMIYQGVERLRFEVAGHEYRALSSARQYRRKLNEILKTLPASKRDQALKDLNYMAYEWLNGTIPFTDVRQEIKEIFDLNQSDKLNSGDDLTSEQKQQLKRNELGQELSDIVKLWRKHIDELTRKYVQNQVFYDNNVIVGIDPNLNIYLEYNYDALIENEKRIKDLREAEKNDIREIGIKYSEEQLRSRYSEEKQKAIELEVRWRNEIFNQTKESASKIDWYVDSDLKRAMKLMKDRHERELGKLGSIPLDIEQKRQAKSFKDKGDVSYENLLHEVIGKLREETKRVKDNNQDLYTNEINERLGQIRELAELLQLELDAIREQYEGLNINAFRDVVIAATKNNYRKQRQLEKSKVRDITVEQVKYKKQSDGIYTITMLHQNGTRTVIDEMTIEELEQIFGVEVSNEIISDDAKDGFIKLANPEVLTSNPLISRMLANIGKYIHRSYHKHETKDFGNDIDKAREIIGPSIFEEAKKQLRQDLTSSVVTGIKTRYLPNQKKYAIQFQNEYAVYTNEKTLTRAEILRKYGKGNEGVISDKDLKISMKYAKAGRVKVHRISRTNPQSDIKFAVSHEVLSDHITNLMQSNNQPATQIARGFGALDASVLKKRKDIPKHIRVLMGEIMDPVANYTNTIFHMAQSLETHKALQGMLDEGDNASVSEKETAYHTKKLQQGDLPFWNFKEGQEIWVTPELYNAMNFGDRKIDGATRLLVLFTSYAKMATTVFFQGSQNRNFLGAILNLAATGTINLHQIGEAMAIASQGMLTSDRKLGKMIQKAALYMSSPLFVLSIIMNKSVGDRGGRGKFSSEYLKESYQTLLRYGIVEDDIVAGQIQELMDMAEKSKNNTNKLSQLQDASNYRKVVDAFSDVYQLSDNLFKTLQFMKERRYLEKAYDGSKSQEDIDAEAADIVRRTQPTYSRLPQIFRKISVNPFFGTFINFKAAMYQTRFNILAIAKEELDSGNAVKKKRGLERLAGFTSTMALQKALKYTSMSFYGWSDDEDRSLSALGPYYYENNDRVYLSGDKRFPEYIDFSYVNPAADFDRPVNALLNGQGTTGFFKELLGPVLAEEIFFKAFKQAAITGEDEFGRELYSNSSGALTKFGLGVYHVGVESLMPKVIQEYSNMGEALGEQLGLLEPSEFEDSFNNRSLQNLVANTFLGVKTNKVDPYMGAKYKIRRYLTQLNDLEQELGFGSPSGLVKRDINNATGYFGVDLLDQAKKHKQAWEMVKKYVDDLRNLDPNADDKIFDEGWLYKAAHFQSKISQKEASTYKEGVYPGLSFFFSFDDRPDLQREYELKYQNDPETRKLF